MHEDRDEAYRAELARRIAVEQRRKAEIAAARAAAPAPRPAPRTVAAAPVPVHAAPPPPALDIESQARREYELSAALPAEFGNVETYIAFRRAEAAGRIKIFGVPRR